MANYIYLPVNSIEMKNFATNSMVPLEVQFDNILVNKVTAGVGKAMYRWINKCLKQVQANDKLYIFLHGAGVADSSFVGAKRSRFRNNQVLKWERGLEKYEGGQLKKYTPKELASTLRKEGLRSSVTEIHLLTCGSGFSGEKDSWAKRLKDALSKHCNNLEVTGYEGFVAVSPDNLTIQVGSEFHPLEDKAVTY